MQKAKINLRAVSTIVWTLSLGVWIAAYFQGQKKFAIGMIGISLVIILLDLALLKDGKASEKPQR